MQSIPVSPPPTTTTRLLSALITRPGGVWRKGRPSAAATARLRW